MYRTVVLVDSGVSQRYTKICSYQLVCQCVLVAASFSFIWPKVVFCPLLYAIYRLHNGPPQCVMLYFGFCADFDGICDLGFGKGLGFIQRSLLRFLILWATPMHTITGSARQRAIFAFYY